MHPIPAGVLLPEQSKVFPAVQSVPAPFTVSPTEGQPAQNGAAVVDPKSVSPTGPAGVLAVVLHDRHAWSAGS